MQLINNNNPQAFQEPPPPLFPRQDPRMDHIEIRKDDARRVPDPGAFLEGGVTVVGCDEGVWGVRGVGEGGDEGD